MSTIVRPCLAFAAMVLMVVLWTGAAGAQTWNWRGRMDVPNRPPVETQTGVVLSAREVVMTYSAHVDDRDLPITSCRAGLPDIATVRMVNLTKGRYLFVSMKPKHTATCASGNQPIALVPIGIGPTADAALTSVMHACCSAAPVAVARAIPVARPAATPAAAMNKRLPALVPPDDWIENQGVFAFVRIHNRDGRPLTIAAGEIANCRAVVSGCGRFATPQLTLAPAGIATLATVMSADPNGPQFSYRYRASIGSANYTGGGSANKHATVPNVAMSAEQVRTAEAVAVAGINTVPSARAPAQTTYVAPRLTRRGSTRLGIGQRGVAVVHVSLGQSGMPQDASIVSISNRALIAAALELAVSSTYAPARRDGRAANSDYIATFQFDGADPALAATPVWRRGPSPAPSIRSAGPQPVSRSGPAAPAPSSPSPTGS